MNHNDGFENYRRQRERLRRMAGAERRPLSGPANALRELEEVEAREERDRQLTSEMKDFFESATRIAADIVQKVADSAKVRIDEQLSGEMQEFLMDSIARVQGLVTAVLKENSASTAEQVIEPLMHNLVGHMLDNFRIAGTAGVDKHLGVNPLATNLDEVRKEFLAKMPAHPTSEDTVVPVETPTLGVPPPAAAAIPGVPVPAPAPTTHPADPDMPAVRASIDEHLVAELGPGQDKVKNEKEDLERFQQALDALVRQGTMSKDEAKTALKARKHKRR